MKLKNFFLGITLFIVGLLMVIIPNGVFNFIIVVLGAASVIMGFYDLFFTYKLANNGFYHKVVLIKGLVSLLVGFAAVVFPFVFSNAIETVIKVMTFVLASFILLFAVGSFLSGTKIDDKNVRKRFTIEGLTYLGISILLFVLGGTNIVKNFIRIVGIVAMVVGVVLVLLMIINMKKNEPQKAEVVEVKDAEPVSSKKLESKDSDE